MAVDPVDLTTLENAYAWLKLKPGSDDLGLQLAITAASARITSWCSRALAPIALDEVYDGTGSTRILLRNYPVIAIESLVIDGREIPRATTRGGPGYRCDGRRTLDLVGDYFPRGPGNIAVAYTAGFAPIPADLQMACLDWLKAGYEMRDRDPTLIGRRAADHEERYAPGTPTLSVAGRTVPMPAAVYAVLSQYQNTLPV